MTLDTGEEIDVDLDSADRPMFDVWRLQSFLASRSELCSDDVLEAELDSLVEAGVLTRTEGWFLLLLSSASLAD